MAPISPAQPVQVNVAHVRRRWPWVIGIFVAFFFGIGIGAQEGGDVTTASDAEPLPAETVTVTEPGTTVTVTPKPAKPSGTIPGDGTFLVGSEIKPGTYRTKAGDACYWARSSGTSGDIGDIIANGNPRGSTVVTIKPTDKSFQTAYCAEWVPVK